jgi:hypothetical protein
MKLTRISIAFALAAVVLAISGCGGPKSSDSVQRDQQEAILQEGTAALGMPSIKNFREKRLLKMIYELRDQDGLRTYTYVVNKMNGKPVFLCDSMGYAINDATGYTNPDKVVANNSTVFGTMTQAEPNGLFTPSSSNAYWIMCLGGDKPTPVFVSGDIIVSPIKFGE